MNKNVFGRQFKRDTNERKSLFKGLMTSLVMHERIQTTEEKAKAIRGSIEKLVTKAKKKGVNATPQLLPYLNEDAVKRMISDIAPRFANRPGGYTRIVKVGRRFGDDASVVIMEWVENGVLQRVQKREGKKNSEKSIETVEARVAQGKDKKAVKSKKEEVKVKKTSTKETKKTTDAKGGKK
jgi:large subunit ribosomal protein L17